MKHFSTFVISLVFATIGSSNFTFAQSADPDIDIEIGPPLSEMQQECVRARKATAEQKLACDRWRLRCQQTGDSEDCLNAEAVCRIGVLCAAHMLRVCTIAEGGSDGVVGPGGFELPR